jgi:IclR family transcriptional regulator, KDG regulon repressor
MTTKPLGEMVDTSTPLKVPSKAAKAEDDSKSPRSSSVELLNLIEELAQFDRIGVTRLSRHLGIPVANAHRMLRVLERTGFVEQLSESKEYRLTLRLFEIGCQIANRTTMRDVVTVEIERLAQQLGLTTSVGVLVDDYVLYLVKVETDDLITLNLRAGSRAPLTCTALGKAMLSIEERGLRSVVGDGPFEAKTEFSITTYDDLVEEIATTRRLGYAVERQELSRGMWSVAAPILGTRNSQNAAVCATSYGVELSTDEIEQLGKSVMSCAARITRRMGGLGDLHSWEVARAGYPRP